MLQGLSLADTFLLILYVVLTQIKCFNQPFFTARTCDLCLHCADQLSGHNVVLQLSLFKQDRYVLNNVVEQLRKAALLCAILLKMSIEKNGVHPLFRHCWQKPNVKI